MNISETSKQVGLPAKTIRYYEEIGLINPSRGSNGYRNFQDTDMHKLKFLARARSLGFNIDECRQLLALFENRDRASSDVKSLAQSHLEQMDQKLAELQNMRNTLANLVNNCAGDDRPDCPILEGLQKPA